MSENKRNRSEGWKHAKLSGHNNENRVKDLLDNDKEYAEQFITRIGCKNKKIKSISIGGLHETSVPGIAGKKTKSKTDLKIFFDDGKIKNISIKKSLGGQLYLVRVNNFIDFFERQFNKTIPTKAQRALKLFWADAEDSVQIIKKYADKNNKIIFEQQIRHKSLNATTLQRYDKSLYDSLLNWFKNNMFELTKLAFSMGAVKSSLEWPEFVWYKNSLGENDIDEIFNIEKLCTVSKKYAESKTSYGDKNGGTTIQLPFGFVQWHQQQMQFHHQYFKIKDLLNN